jgi:ribosomal protein S18
MGLLNYGAFYDKVEKGISGSIKLDHRDITFGNWAHQRGLEGEYKRVRLSYLYALVLPESRYS